MIIGPLALVGSFLLSRAALALGKGNDPPAKKWLIYPSLIIVYTLLLTVGMCWPAILGGAVAVTELEHHDRFSPDHIPAYTILFIIIFAGGRHFVCGGR